ncbi:hypothetical protein HZC34_07660 [Candidatus Saganbacteria bacterium]|nr:hypothetical protein [Candidatus Saganbacteria bacterium]
MILALDPGLLKCGLAVLDASAHVLDKKIIEIKTLDFEITSFVAKYAVNTVVVGSGTGSKEIQKSISKLNLPADIATIREANSTLEAKKLYFRENPPSFFMRLIPISLQTPPRPIDDYAAIILGERYLKG